MLPEHPTCASDLPAYRARLQRILDHFMIEAWPHHRPVYIELEMDCTHRDQVVFAYSSTYPNKSRPLPSRGLCNVVDSFHATRGAQMKTITKASGLRPRMEQVLDEAVVWRYLDKFIAAVLKDKQTVNKPLTPANYGGVWPPIKTPPRGLERSYAMMPTQPALPDTQQDNKRNV